nr:uncharacterized protein LOC107375943 [Nothobranchius furzeri]
MAYLEFTSQLFLVALFSFSAQSFAAKTGWKWNLQDGGGSSKNVNSGPQSFSSPVQPRAVTSSVSWVAARPQRQSLRVPTSETEGPAVPVPPKPQSPALSRVTAPERLPAPPNPEGPAVPLVTAPPKELPAPPLNPQIPAIPWTTSLSVLQKPTDQWGTATSINLPTLNSGGPVQWGASPLSTIKGSSPSNPEMSVPKEPAAPWFSGPIKVLPVPYWNPQLPPIPWLTFPSSAQKKPLDLWGTAHSTNLLTLQSKGPVPWQTGPLNPRGFSVPQGITSPNPGGPVVSLPFNPLQKGVSVPQGLALSQVVNTHDSQVMPLGSNVDTMGEDPMESSYFHSEPSYHPVQPNFQAGELYNFERNVDQGNLNGEMEVLDGGSPFIFQEPFHPGELSNAASIFEQGSSQKETEDQSFVPSYPNAELETPYALMDTMQLAYPHARPAVPDLFYQFLMGRLPHGTVSHTQTEYMTGGDRTTKHGYERYRYLTDDLDAPPQIEVYTEQ